MRSVLAAFYSHPWAWNEIGFGGPAYPRGYARLGPGLGESWEGDEAGDVDPGREQGARPRMRLRVAAPRQGIVCAVRERLGASCSTRTGAASPGASGCAASATRRRSTWSSSAAEPAARPSPSASRAPGWRIVVLERGSLLGPRRGLGLRRGGLAAPLLERHADHRRRRSGRAREEQLGARRRRLDGALRRLRAPLSPLRLRDADTRRGRVRLAALLLGPEAALRAGRAGAPGRRRGLAVGRPARLPARAAPDLRRRRAQLGRARASTASRCASARSRSPTASSATGPTASTAASASRAARSTRRRARSSPTSPTRSRTAPRFAPTRW